VKTSSTNGNPKIKNAVRTAAAALFWLAVWQGVYMAVRQEILVVSPAAVLVRLSELVQEGAFWVNTAGSLIRVLSGFLIAVVLGTVLAALSHRFALVKTLTRPAISIIKATPVASFIILALVWMRSAHMPVLISMLMVLPGVYVNLLEGIRNVDPELLEMTRVFRFPVRKVLTKLYLPSVVPYFIAACTTGLGLAWKAGVAAEVLGNTVGSIGGQIYESKIYLETLDLFSWTLVVILLSMAIEKTVLVLLARLSFERTDNEGKGGKENGN